MQKTWKGIKQTLQTLKTLQYIKTLKTTQMPGKIPFAVLPFYFYLKKNQF